MFTCANLSLVEVRTHLDYQNSSISVEALITGKDAAWILTSSVIIFSMQTGFGLLESGCVNSKNEVNIMVKNALDVVFGGITYWAFGFGLSYGTDSGANPFFGIGCFFVDAKEEKMGYIYAVFIFQLSFASTSTTIVSGAMAERTRLHAYIVFSMLNTIIYSIPAHWIWASNGFLYSLGCLDAAGCGPVHLIGGTTGLVATLMLGRRKHTNNYTERSLMPSPVKAILGMLMLWWAWLRFNSGSIFVISTDAQWKLAVRAAVNTIISSLSGGIMSVLLSLLISLKTHGRRYDVSTIVTGILGSLVAITGICTMCRPWESLLIGVIAAVLTMATEGATEALRIDDPVGVIPVHLVCGIWGLLCVGLFIEEKQNHLAGSGGLFKTGSWYLLGVQTLAAVSMFVWTVVTSYLLLKVIDLTIGLRLSPEDEALGCDVIEHGVLGDPYSRSMGDKSHNYQERAQPQPGDWAAGTEAVGSGARPGAAGTGTAGMEGAARRNGRDNNLTHQHTHSMSFFQDLLLACNEQDLQIKLRCSEPNSIVMEIGLVLEAPDAIAVPPDVADSQTEAAETQTEANANGGCNIQLATISLDSGLDVCTTRL